jgi:hypothetical protein
MDWKALLSPELVFDYPVRTLGMICAVLGLFHPPLDFNNRYLALGSFLLFFSFAGQKSGAIWFTTAHGGPRYFSAVAFFQSVALWIFTAAFALLFLHQLGQTPRFDALPSALWHAHSVL